MSKPIVSPSLKPLLGRYEFTDGLSSDKFWTITFVSRNGMYLAEWGKNGYGPQGEKEYTGIEALKKIQEKIGKGYRLVTPVKLEPSTGLPLAKPKRKKREETPLKSDEPTWEEIIEEMVVGGGSDES